MIPMRVHRKAKGRKHHESLPEQLMVFAAALTAITALINLIAALMRL